MRKEAYRTAGIQDWSKKSFRTYIDVSRILGCVHVRFDKWKSLQFKDNPCLGHRNTLAVLFCPLKKASFRDQCLGDWRMYSVKVDKLIIDNPRLIWPLSSLIEGDNLLTRQLLWQSEGQVSGQSKMICQQGYGGLLSVGHNNFLLIWNTVSLQQLVATIFSGLLIRR